MSTNAVVSVGIFALFMLAAVALGLLSLRGRDRTNLAEWSVGGRSLGTVLIFVLMAGETYTSFSYLGAAGWSYNYGMPVFYLLAYLAIGFAVGYVVGPILWNYAHRNNLHNITDITAYRFNSPWLGAAVAILTTVFLLPYIQLQITGMGVVVSTISYGTIGLGAGYIIAFLVTEAFIIFSGLRGSAWVSILKDSLVIITLLVVFVYVPVHYFGGLGPMLDRLVSERPEWLVLPGHGKESLGMLWFATTGLLNGVVYTIFPTTVAGYLGVRLPPKTGHRGFMPRGLGLDDS
ncbi:sodium:solute symporter family transporter [Saccharopolyspora sp. NPDC003752]